MGIRTLSQVTAGSKHSLIMEILSQRGPINESRRECDEYCRCTSVSGETSFSVVAVGDWTAASGE